MTPRYTIGVWVGNDQKTRSIGRGADGAKVALPIWIRMWKMKDRAHRSAGRLGRAERRVQR